MIRRKNRTLLTDKSTRPDRLAPGQLLDKIPEKSFKKRTVKQEEPAQSKLANLTKSMRMSETELAFLKEYRALEDLEREKGIKFFECIGDPPATAEFVDGVKVFRQNFVTDKLNQMRTKDVHRFTTEINTDKVVVPTDVDISAQPKWDVFENNHFAMRKRLVDIFLKVANKQIIRMRAGKRLAKLKQRFRDLGVTSKEDCRRLVAEDWKDSLNVRADGAAGE